MPMQMPKNAVAMLAIDFSTIHVNSLRSCVGIHATHPQSTCVEDIGS